jgi:pyruvate,water dikinase
MTQLVVPLAAPEAADANRFGPKAVNQAALGRAGLPIPGGFCLDAEAYRMQLAAIGLEAAARQAASTERPQARRFAAEVKLGLFEQPIVPTVLEPLLGSWRALMEATGTLTVVRSSALMEDRPGSTFAGQFESFLGLDSEADFLTAVRACWAALWSTRALRYMAIHDVNPAETAMALLVQPLVAARASGGGLSLTADGGMLLNATWGLGSAIAQGEVVPDRFVLSREGLLCNVEAGRKDFRVGCVHYRQEPTTQAVAREFVAAPCLDEEQVVELGRMLRKVEEVLGGPVEIEWALDDAGFKLLQARPLHVEPAHVPDEIWLRHPGLNGHPAGIGWGSGRACVINCECELSRVAPGDILVTRVAGPALNHVLPRVAGVVAELGGSTSHLASLARERGLPMVLGVLDATQRIPDGVQVAVDGVTGVVRWIR